MGYGEAAAYWMPRPRVQLRTRRGMTAELAAYFFFRPFGSGESACGSKPT